MSDYRKVTAILNPPPANKIGDGFRIHNFTPDGYKIDLDPFYLIDYNACINVAACDKQLGVHSHPHRGLESVTLVYYGAIEHLDSAGNTGIINAGEVEWTTAGRGILHKEIYESEFSKNGGPLQLVQLWVNLPAAHKLCPPKYQPIKRKDMGLYELANNLGCIEVIAGNYLGVNGPAETFTDIEMYNGRLNKGAFADFRFLNHHNSALLVLEGDIIINEAHPIQANQMVYFKPGNGKISVRATTNCIILLLSGAPINEPIVQFGPFLMNNNEELEKAILDYNYGEFGYLS